MNAAQAKKEGKVWMSLTVSGGKNTPLLGPVSISAKGPKDPDTAFLIYMLFSGHTIKGAQAKKAKS